MLELLFIFHRMRVGGRSVRKSEVLEGNSFPFRCDQEVWSQKLFADLKLHHTHESSQLSKAKVWNKRTL